ncbi:MAG TPA: hypothetical protein VFG87_16940 [Amycolatopsis sp.]|nr:hypothetical protein [Amycolatopsis sp.]
MSEDLSAVIAATARWLLRAYPPSGGVFSATLAETQAEQAVTVAAWLRYPTVLDASLVALVGPGGSARLDRLMGVDADALPGGRRAWRGLVDEVVASWAACLLGDRALAAAAVTLVATSEHVAGRLSDFRRLVDPDERDRKAAALLRHPDLVARVADLHGAELLRRLGVEPATEDAA